MDVAFQHRLAALGQREQVVPARFGHRLPERGPGLRARAIGEPPGAHQHRGRRDVGDTAGADRDVKGLFGGAEQAVDIEPAAARNQRGITVEHRRELSERVAHMAIGSIQGRPPGDEP